MKHCKDVQAALFQQLDGLASEEIPAKIREHLQNCERCQRLQDSLAEVDSAIAFSGAVPYPQERYFDELPAVILDRLNTKGEHSAASQPEDHKLSLFERLFAGRFAKPAIAFAAVAIVAVAVYQSLPEGAKVTFVRNTQKIDKSAGEQPRPAATLSQVDEKGETARDEQQSLAGTDKKASGTTAEKLSQPSAGAGIAAEHETQKAAPPAIAAADSIVKKQSVAEDLRSEDSTTTIRLASEAAVDALAGRAAQGAFVSTNAPAQATSLRSKAVEPEAYELAAEKGAAVFALFFRKAQNAASHQERAEIWQRFLEATRDSSQYALGLVELAKTTKNLADESIEVLQLANAVAWFEQHEKTLKPLMGEQEFGKYMFELRERLQLARTGKLR